MKFAIAQIDRRIGDFEGNARRILDAAEEAFASGARLLLLPRRCLGGEPAGALRRHPEFFERGASSLKAVASRLPREMVVVLGVEVREERVHDALAILREGRVELVTTEACTSFDWEGRRIGVAQASLDPAELDARLASLRGEGVELALVPGAQPFFVGGHGFRRELLRSLARRHGLALALAEPTGGSDSLVFEGGSLVVDAEGRAAEARRFEADLLSEEIEPSTADPDPSTPLPDRPSSPLALGHEVEDLASALTLGIRDYVRKSGFERAVFGLSGGVDSAVVAVLAAHALGPKNVVALAMPSRYTSEMSMEDSQILASRLGIRMEVVPIDPVVEALSRSLTPVLGEKPSGATAENLQARARGTLLMAFSNHLGALVLNTGNKSELSVGYSTLYGDMVGAIGVLGDLPKTWVYELARHLNLRHGAIPPRVLSRPPSAELRPDQTDQDSLPPYDRLDRIFHLALDEGWSVARMREAHEDEETLRRSLSLLFGSAYKRKQAVPPIRVTLGGLHEEAYPVTHAFRPWED